MNKKVVTGAVLTVIVVFSFGFISRGVLGDLFNKENREAIADNLEFNEQEATVRAIKRVIPSVVSIVVYDYAPFEGMNMLTGRFEMQEIRKQKMKGTGFLISPDGYILTNRHVVEAASKERGEYQVTLNSGKKYYAQFIDKDNANDLAVLKIFDKDLPHIELGDSATLELGISVIAIGNALGRYENSVTKGIVSGLGRSLTASDISGNSELLDNVIQTDAKINQGNSGGPLIDLAGRVVGINTAIEAQGSAIGFAIPINDAKPVIRSIIEHGRIFRPLVGVRYMMVTSEIARENNLPRLDGAWVTAGIDHTYAVMPGSPAELGGIRANDIIFEINAIKIDENNPLLSVVQRFRPGDRIGLKIQRDNQIIIREIVLTEMK